MCVTRQQPAAHGPSVGAEAGAPRGRAAVFAESLCSGHRVAAEGAATGALYPHSAVGAGTRTGQKS